MKKTAPIKVKCYVFRLWDYQACTQMVMPSCSTGVNDMFPPSKWDYQSYAQSEYSVVYETVLFYNFAITMQRM